MMPKFERSRRRWAKGRGRSFLLGRARQARSTDARRRRRADPDLERERRSERAGFATRIDVELQVACRGEAAARRELGCAARVLLGQRAYRRLGFVRLGDYARERLGVSARTVQSAAWLATRLDALPAVSTAFDRSAISWAQARAICAVASAADEDRWLEIARRCTVDELERRVRSVAPPCGVAVDPDRETPDVDGEPAVRWRLACPARVRALWRRALELASRAAGESLADWRAAEVIAAEGFSGRPAGAPIAERALLTSLRLARRARRSAGPAAVGDESPPVPATNAASADIAIATSTISSTIGAAARRPASPSPRAAAAPGDPFALDARLVAAMRAIQTTEPRIGRLLRAFVDYRLYRLLDFPSLEAYARERLGISVRKVWALLKVERATARSDEFARAYRDGTLSWARALTLLPVVDRANAAAWVGRAEIVTARRLYDEMNWVLEARDTSGGRASLDPPPLDSRLTSATVATNGHGNHDPGDGVQIGAHGTEATDRHVEVCDVEATFIGPASVVALLRDVLDAFAPPGAPRWAALERLLLHVIAYWETTPRHRDPIFARDGWQCSVPACSSRRNLHDHHLRFRSRGGDNEPTNRVTVCAAHHLHGIHGGAVRAWGTAPRDVHWELGMRWGAPPLLTYVGDRLWPQSRQGSAEPTRKRVSNQAGFPQRILELGKLVPMIAHERAPAAMGDDLETDAVGIGEERGVVVGRVLWIERRRASRRGSRDDANRGDTDRVRPRPAPDGSCTA